MRKTNEQIDELIAGQEERITETAAMVDVKRGHVSKAGSQQIENIRKAISTFEGLKELTTVNLRAGV